MASPKPHSYTVGAPRRLREDERNLIAALLRTTNKTSPLIPELENALVQDMNDGGMGSLRFVGAPDRLFGSAPVEASFSDDDGVSVSLAIFLDQSGALFELDVFKADNRPIVRLPSFDEVTIDVRPN